MANQPPFSQPKYPRLILKKPDRVIIDPLNNAGIVWLISKSGTRQKNSCLGISHLNCDFRFK
jgi:hypothetical protein